MKINPTRSCLFLVSLAGAIALPSSLVAAAPKPELRTEVLFFERENFTDVRDSSFHSDKGRDAILDQLKTHLHERAQTHVPEGAKLSVTIKDVDLAGDFEPWRGASALDVRIVKEIYAPRISLAFQLTDANGEVVKQGTRQLRNLDFMSTVSGSFNDPYRHDKALLDEWLRTEFQRVKKN